ncbi:MAG TPA: efflux RND transporter periplasmic adaptor subunit [Flavisolibacter sp.]|nr:efflux RND transporter periplasmic adaptor subunit [Flavisolibacter sp.]
MSKSLKWILISVGILAVLLVAGKMISGNSAEGTKVTAEKAGKRTIIETVNASGKVYPEVEVKISPDISGEITELNVEEGDSVKRGQVLARIYADIYSSQRDEAAARVAQSQATVANSEASLDALKAQLQQDKTVYDRNKELYDQKVISKSEFEQYDTKFRSSQAQYNAALQNIRSLQEGTKSSVTTLVMANKNLGRTTLTAPMDGVISLLNVKKGERVVGTAQMAGTEMMRVADMSMIEVRVDVGENDIVKVNIGDSADVKVEAYNNRKFPGVVTQIASSTKTSTTAAASADVTNYEVHIRLIPSYYKDLMVNAQTKKFPFRPGMNASADIKTKQKDNVITVPIAAVGTRIKGSDKNIDQQKKENKKATDDNSDDNQNTVNSNELDEVVFVIKKDNTIEKRIVTTGIQDINYFEIKSGLQPGEQVVTGPFDAVSKSLKAGAKVNVVTKDKLFQK